MSSDVQHSEDGLARVVSRVGGDIRGLFDLREGGAVVDEADQAIAGRVTRIGLGECLASLAQDIGDGVGIVDPMQMGVQGEQVTVEALGSMFRALQYF